MLDQVAILGQFADEWIDLTQTERSLRAAFQIAAYEAILGNAPLQCRRTGIVASRAAILFRQLDNALDATHSELTMAGMDGVADRADVCSGLLRTDQKLQQLRRCTTWTIRIADAMPTTLAAQVAEGFPIHELLYPLLVDSKGRVKVKTNWYSTSLWPGLPVTAVVGPLTVEIMHDNKVAAQHPRCYGRGHEILDLEHYRDVLERKPGAMKGLTPLQQWRQAGRWSACLDAIWRELEQHHGKSKGR